MMELVDNHDVKRGWIEVLQIDLCERLNGRKHMPPLVGPVTVHVQFTKVSRPQDLPKCPEALLENLLAMRDKQHAQIAVLITQTFVVQCGDDRLASSGGGDYEILEAVMPFALHRELLEHLALMRPGFDVQEEKRCLERVALLRCHRAIEASGIPSRFIRLVFGTLPVRVERGVELLDYVRRAHLG